MEVNNPQANPNDLYYVTTGLLVEEMVTGQRQLGDTQFEAYAPATIQVAGDSNENGANAIAPRYASFKGVASVSPGQNSAKSTPGAVINRRIFPDGSVSDYTPTQRSLIGSYDSVTGHNIAEVFRRYGDQSGPVWNGQRYVQDKVFFNNPTYVLGRPITEPYWVHAVVAGVEREVLVQLFERRVLTYTPTNPAAYQVEMGNTGQHYYRWRYDFNQKPPVLITNNLRGQFVGATDYMVWVEYNDVVRSIHAYNFHTKEQFVVKDGLKDDVLDLKADGNKIIWFEIAPVNHIVVYDLDARQQVGLLDAKNNPVTNITLYKGVLYYSLSSNGQYGIYSYNLATSELKLVTDKVLGEAVVGDGYVLWKEAVPSADYPKPVKLHLFRLSDGNDQVLLDTKSIVDHFSIADGKIFWTDFQMGTTGVYLYDIATGNRQQLTDNFVITPFFSGGRLIWTHAIGDNGAKTYAIIGYDLATGQTRTLLSDSVLSEAGSSANPLRLVYKHVNYGYHGEMLYALDLS